MCGLSISKFDDPKSSLNNIKPKESIHPYCDHLVVLNFSTTFAVKYEYKKNVEWIYDIDSGFIVNSKYW